MTTRWKSLAAVVATVAVGAAGTLVGASAGPASATHADRVAASSISIRVLHHRIEAGDSDRVVGNLSIRGAVVEEGRPVLLEARSQGQAGFTPVGTATTGPRGGLSMDVAPLTTTRYRWHFEGAADARPSKSGVAVIKVAPRQHHAHRLATTLSIRATPRIVDAPDPARIRGRLRLRHLGVPRRDVQLLAKPDAGADWAVVDHQLTDRFGAVVFQVSPTARTAYRLAFDGSRLLRPARSGIVRIGVRPEVTASASPVWLNPGGSTTVTGLVTFEGLPLAGANVELRARKAHSSSGFHVVGTGVTAADGSVAISDTPDTTTVYRLVVLHSAGVPRGVSDPVRVHLRYSTSLSIRGRHAPIGFVVSGILRGHRTVIRGATVSLLALPPGSTTWSVVGSDQTGRRGKVTFVEPDSEGASYQLSYAGGEHLAPSTSGIVVD